MIRPGGVIKAYSLRVWFLRGMENGSHHILGPQIGAKRTEEALQLGRHHCKREQRGKHNDTTLWNM